MAIDARVTGIPSSSVPLPNTDRTVFSGKADANDDMCETANHQGM